MCDYDDNDVNKDDNDDDSYTLCVHLTHVVRSVSPWLKTQVIGFASQCTYQPIVVNKLSLHAAYYRDCRERGLTFQLKNVIRARS